MKDFSYVTSQHPAYIESLYTDYQKNPEGIDPEWKKFFEGFDFATSKVNGNGAASKQSAASGEQTGVSGAAAEKEFAVLRLIRGYRKRGHLIATTNPVRPRRDRHPHIDLADYGLAESDMDTRFATGTFVGLQNATLREILDKLKRTYAGDIGIEYTYITDLERVNWVEREFEAMMERQLSIEQKKRILEKLNQGVIFEKFLHTKYIGQKRFSLEGGESTIPALDTLINDAASTGAKEVVIGMAHRGRLNVLANTLGKTYEQIFSEFEGNMPEDTTMGSGDVKYHLGFRADIQAPSGESINVQLSPNPSHLEVVDPVVAGFARAKADSIYASEYDRVLPILIHGDAAIAGQGVVYELVQMSKLEGYASGGTVHFVINNQVGFTTDFEDARSSDYSTSVAAIVQAPVLHVNGDNPEAVVKAAQFALRYRQEFNQDVFIDMVCYRRHGHNEGDDPSFTQPDLYAVIKNHPNPREVYNKSLLERGDVDASLAQEMEKKFWDDLQQRLDGIKQKPLPYTRQAPEQAWAELRRAETKDFQQSPETGIPKEKVETLVKAMLAIPDGFTPLRKVKKLLEEKGKLFSAEGVLDWSMGELLAYASLVAEGRTVRLSGQDVQRGTFSHRHAVLHDEKSNAEHNRLSNLGEGQGVFRIYNSLLSEFAVLGYEYGYSIADPNALAIWEAQFGDFANGCQTVIDQYLSSAETKWGMMSGLMLLLPHGYEGQGPEHSSARLERFLQLCAENNLVITNITTAANFFHAVRRQLAWPFRKPLVNFSPKAHLRLPKTYSSVEEFTTGGFHEVIDDAGVQDAKTVKRVLLCSGKVYFDLLEKQQNDKRADIAIVRLEQIHPLPTDQLVELKKKYGAAEWMWVQEEPRNMGAWGFISQNLEMPMKCASRKSSASPATGYGKMHAKEQAEILAAAFE